GEHRDDVAGLEQQVLLGIAVDDRLAEIERYQRGGEIVAVEALDHRIVPVDFALRGLDLVDEALRVGFRGLEGAFARVLEPGDLHGAGSLVRIEELRRFRLRLYAANRSEEHTSELLSLRHLVCRLLLEKKK